MMIRLSYVVSLWLSAFLTVSAVAQECLEDDYRLTIDAKINGQPVCLIVDTGSRGALLFRTAANHLKLKTEPATGETKPLLDEIQAEVSEPFDFEFGGKVSKGATCVVADCTRSMPGVHGVLGWAELRGRITELDWGNSSVTFCDTLPTKVLNWSKITLADDTPTAIIDINRGERSKGMLFLDTGSEFGIDLNATNWTQWKSDHADMPKALSAAWYFGGLSVCEETWAHQIVLSPFTFDEIPVKESPAFFASTPDFEACIGVYALSCFHIVIDGPQNTMYFCHNNSARKRYRYNRLGAVFVPKNKDENALLVARVLPTSPAFRSGIRDGDELTQIENLDATKWRSDSKLMPLGQFFERSAGTKIDLSVLRNGAVLRFSVALEELLPGATTSTGAQKRDTHNKCK